VKKRYAVVGALAAGAALAGTVAVRSAGAAERRELVICNWTDSGLNVETGLGGNIHMISQGCAPSFYPEIGGEVKIVIAGWDRVPHETHWWMPGQNMRLDIVGDVTDAQYDPTYW
jgi:hypothetical protein